MLIATWPATSALRIRCVLTPSDTDRAVACRALWGSVRLRRQAGSNETTTPVTSERPTANTSTSTVQSHFLEAWQVDGRARDERADAPPGDEDAEGAARGGQQQVLQDDLPNHASPARANRGADGRLTRASRRAREQQRRQVHAEHQQHRADGPRKQQETASSASDNLLLEREHERSELDRLDVQRPHCLANDLGLHGVHLRLCYLSA